MGKIETLSAIHRDIKVCRACPNMCGAPVHGPAIETDIMLVGQAPGPHEGKFGKPFAYTSGKTLFKWFQSIGVEEESFRSHVYITATARCFPGKSGKGDRVPSRQEIDMCAAHVSKEVSVIKPKLIIAVGRLAITEVLGPLTFPKSKNLSEVVGKKFQAEFHGHKADVVCLPHPSGVSRWPRSEEGSKKLALALELIKEEFLQNVALQHSLSHNNVREKDD